MRKTSLVLALLGAAVLQGCGLFTVYDDYGNGYGGFFDYGGQYRWQLATCQSDLTARAVPELQRKRFMQCCMWRHGVPIDNSTGCDAPPLSG